jgi:hypothetical protein
MEQLITMAVTAAATVVVMLLLAQRRLDRQARGLQEIHRRRMEDAEALGREVLTLRGVLERKNEIVAKHDASFARWAARLEQEQQMHRITRIRLAKALLKLDRARDKAYPRPPEPTAAQKARSDDLERIAVAITQHIPAGQAGARETAMRWSTGYYDEQVTPEYDADDRDSLVDSIIDRIRTGEQADDVLRDDTSDEG